MFFETPEVSQIQGGEERFPSNGVRCDHTIHMAAGASAAPGWVRWALVCWAAIAALVVSVVLLHSGRQDMEEGEY